MKKITASILTTLLMLSMVFSSSVFAANEETSAWDSFLGLFSAKASADDVGVEYRGHIQNVGDYPTDGSWIQGPERLGTVGKSLRLEAFWIKLTDAPEGLHIKYEVHVQNIGWMAPVEDGKLAGTQGDSLRIEAIKISLVDDEGNVSGDYTVTYKGHIQNVGDTAWIKSGQQLGTTGSGLRLEALEVKIEKIAPDLTDYEAALAAVTEANYTKASWAAYQDVVEANVMTEDNVQSEVDAATAIILDAQEDLVTVPVIAGMTATAQKQITVTGTELSKLSAGMLTVANNTVASVVASADGTSAVVTLGTDLVPETTTKVTATIDGTAKDYTVKYTVAATTVAIQTATFDDDLANQSLTVLVNGVATTVDYLTTSGYSVTFNAWNSTSTNVTGTLLTAKGGIVVPATVGDYTAQVTIAKGSAISTSTKATIKVRNLDNNATDISGYQITDITNGAKLNSTTLYTGETAFVNKVVVGYGDAAAELTTTQGVAGVYNVESANSSVISVNSTTKTMTAVGLGTADITITVGNATKVVTMTVAGTQRKATAVTPASNPFNFVIGGSAAANTLKVVVTDQYGDPFVGATALTYTVPTSITGLACVTPMTSNAKGEVNLALTSATAKIGETGVLVFRNSDTAVVGSCNIATTNQNVVASKKLVVTAGSSDDTLNDELASDKYATYKVSTYAADNTYLGDVASLATYTVTYNADIVTLTTDGVLGARVGQTTTITSGTTITLTAKTAGSTPVTVKDGAGNVVGDTKTITVVKGQPKMTGITFKTTDTVNYIGKINHENVLTLDEVAATTDPIVKNVTLSASSVYKVRMTKADAVTGEILYLDVNSNGTYQAGTDTALGTIKISVANAAGSVMSTTGAVITGVTTNYGSKGTVTFTVTDTVSTTPVVVGTKGVDVNVAASSNPASAITGAALAAGAGTPVGGVVQPVIPSAGGTDNTGKVTGFTSTSADKVTFTVTTPAPAVSTITINGAAYVSGAQYTIAAGTSQLTIVVTTTEPGKDTVARTFTVAVSGVTGSTLGATAETVKGVATVKQVETATTVAADTITTAGNYAVTVRAAGSAALAAGKQIAVPVLVGDTDGVIAGKVRTALAADSDVAAFFTVSGSASNIVLTALTGAANDATMNLSLADAASTCKVGAGAAPTAVANSANTTAGVAEVKEKATTLVATAAIDAGTMNVTVTDGTINVTIPVAIGAGETTSTIGGKIRAALAANSTVAGAYAVTGTTNDIVLTQLGAGADVVIAVTAV